MEKIAVSSADKSIRNPARLYYLDLIRGVAALLVVAGHLRSFIFKNYAYIPADQNTLIAKIFYFATGISHEAVIVFFALSGYLVGGKAIGDILSGKFTWPGYISRRLTRLWIVIIPALLITVVLDRIGVSLTGGAGYDGRYYGLFGSGPSQPDGIDSSPTAFIGNIFFLQTILVPVFGTNKPMWSLANEFWYYIVFPLAAWLVLFRHKALQRVAGLCVLIALLFFLPFDLLVGGFIWVAGAISGWLLARGDFHAVWTRTAVRIAAILILPGSLLLSKVLNFPGYVHDLALGLLIAALLPVMALLPQPNRIGCRIAKASSEISYTLYLTHAPLFTFIVLVWLGPQPFGPNLQGAAVFSALFVLSVVWAAICWWCFERNTDRVYRQIRRYTERGTPRR